MAPRKSSPSRKSRKSPTRLLGEVIEAPEEGVRMGFEGIAYVFLLGAVAAVIAWMVFVAKYNLDFYNQLDEKTIDAHIENGDLTPKDAQTVNQYTICFQAVVASLLLYFCFKYHFHHSE